MAIELPREGNILSRIQKTRRELLDLSSRNRLISTPLGASPGRKIEIVDERADDVFRLLVNERKTFSFLAGSDEAPEPASDEVLPQPAEPDARITDTRLQTRLTSERLQSRLLDMFYDAQTYEQEQGVSILYMACGFLTWHETPTSDKPRYAPLLLVPVDLNRPTAASRFSLRYRDEDITTNLSLQAKLKAEFGIALPDVPDMDDLVPSAYFAAVEKAIADQPRWKVSRDEMVIWFFSFAKYLMYRDLDPANWPAHSPLESNPTLANLLGEGFVTEPSICGENDKIDALIPPSQMVHVTDADSSQAVVIEEVRQGRHLVVQGPPGTGKSQTITNLIASAVKEGKKVLFVAEKMAALEVVQHRLERLGLGALCLEIHSSKANKKAVLEELSRTLALGRPKPAGTNNPVEPLRQAIARLNLHADVLNIPSQPSGLSPFHMIGKLTRLYADGIEPTDLTLTNAETWTSAEFEERRRAVEDLQSHLQEIGPPNVHPWRGVKRAEPILHADLRNLQSLIAETLPSLGQTQESAVNLLQSLNIPATEIRTLEDARNVEKLARHVADAPPMDRSAIGNLVWEARWASIAALVKDGAAREEILKRTQSRLADVAWQTDLSAARRAVASHGNSWFRWFYRDYRAAVATLKGIMNGRTPRSAAERLVLIDDVIHAQNLSKSLDHDPSNTHLGEDAFGSLWSGTKSPWDSFARIIVWATDARKMSAEWNPRKTLAGLERPEDMRKPLNILSTRLQTTLERVDRLRTILSFDAIEAFGAKSLQQSPIAMIFERLTLWQSQPEALSKWIGHEIRVKKMAEIGLEPMTQAVREGRIATHETTGTFEVIYYQALIREIFQSHHELAAFDGASHERAINEFRGLDQGRIAMSRAEVALAHHEAIPRNASGGEMAVVRREIEKKRKHKPIRQLIKEAGSAVLAIKPVFMMSPISVAQYLEPGSVTFDLLLIDEASQVSPVDALGAMSRAKQVVVVGDDKQLPPTRFFNKMLDETGVSDDDDGDLNVGDLESILGLCLAQGMSQRMLRWHYRSRHHSLIAVSNREFYDNRLYVIPSPSSTTADQGLHFRYIANGVFDRGQSATNRIEAQAIADAVLDHALRFPEKSLGVGAFSVSQRDAIRNAIERLQRENPALSEFCAVTT